MRLLRTQRAKNDYRALPEGVQRLVDKQLDHLLQDLRYPSLKAKKYDERRGIWQARVDGSYRLYFLIEGDVYVILTITKHPK
jgi:mRNA-degrading endonuclease RelE of RelBE toxin-antitoxin system